MTTELAFGTITTKSLNSFGTRSGGGTNKHVATSSEDGGGVFLKYFCGRKVVILGLLEPSKHSSGLFFDCSGRNLGSAA